MLFRSIAQIVKCLKKQLAAVDRELEAFIRETPAWSAKAKLLRSVPGVGAEATATLLAELPELGGLTGGRSPRWLVSPRSIATAVRYVARA